MSDVGSLKISTLEVQATGCTVFVSKVSTFQQRKVSLLSYCDSSSDEESDHILDPEAEQPAKKQLIESKRKTTSASGKRKYSKTWEEDFPWLEYDKDCDGAFCETCKMFEKSV